MTEKPFQYDGYKERGVAIGQFWIDLDGSYSEGDKGCVYLVHSFSPRGESYWQKYGTLAHCSIWGTAGLNEFRSEEVPEGSDMFYGSATESKRSGPILLDAEAFDHLRLVHSLNSSDLTKAVLEACPSLRLGG